METNTKEDDTQISKEAIAPSIVTGGVPVPPTTTPVQADPQQLENVTINTTSVESKIGLYTRVTFTSLWVLVLFGCGALNTLIAAPDGAAQVLVFLFSVVIVALPIFLIANTKRNNEMEANPALKEDIFVKKSLRKSLFAAIVLGAISAFYFVYTVLSSLFLSSGTSSPNGTLIMNSLVWVGGFAGIIVFCWNQHAQTKK